MTIHKLLYALCNNLHSVDFVYLLAQTLVLHGLGAVVSGNRLLSVGVLLAAGELTVVFWQCHRLCNKMARVLGGLKRV